MFRWTSASAQRAFGASGYLHIQLRHVAASQRAAVRSRYALISVGPHNVFGHPAASTVSALWRADGATYRTGNGGAVVLEAGATPRVTTMIACGSQQPRLSAN